jgi:ion channel-forming bestrophin family protein
MRQPRTINWFQVAFQLRGSVIPAVLPRVLVCCGFSAVITLVDQTVVPLSWPILGNVIPSIVLGLLLVFRTNTAYERFWEGRKAWGELVNLTRNLARQIWIFIDERDPRDRKAKVDILHLLVAFSSTLKRQLRNQPVNDEVADLMTGAQYQELQSVQHPPLRVAMWIEDYLQQHYKQNQIYIYQLTSLNTLLSRMVDAMGACERILRTPIPVAYAIHLKQLLLIYCLLLPFQLVGELGFWTIGVVGVISFSLFGIEEIGVEIENPFGHDLNDLPLDTICNTMRQNIEDLIHSSPQGCSSEALSDHLR